MIWVTEPNVFRDDDGALGAAAESVGDVVLRWRDVWWLSDRWPRLNGEVVMFHGSLGNADRIATELPWRPGAWCTTDRFRCSQWWPAVAGRLVSADWRFTTAAGLVADGFPESWGTACFVRPDSPLKPFSGRVVSRDRLSLRALDHGFYYDDEELPVVVTPVCELGDEWRFVVAGGEVVTGSGYRADGRSPAGTVVPEHPAWTYAQAVVAEIEPPDPVFVLDVVETADGLRLLELNPFSGADLYDCDRHAIVAAVHSVLG